MAIIQTRNLRNGVKAIEDTFTCSTNAVIGDFVRASLTIDNAVVVSTNTDKHPIIGVIINKPTETTAKILLLGVLEGFSGLAKGSPVYLTSLGIPTTTVPIGNIYLQILGIAFSESSFYFNPQLRVVRRNP